MSRVLVVDDERSIRLTLQAILNNAGYTTDVAENAEDALQMLGQGTYDVVVSDIVLPRVSGVMLLKAIRERAPDVQVLMMTGDPTVETAAEAVRAGAADYIVKPVPRDTILRSVASAARIKALDDERRRLQESNRQQLEQLMRQNEELRRAEAFRDEVDAVMRHDLKSPLTLIIGAPQTLLDLNTSLPEADRSLLRSIEQAGYRMLDMINLSLDLFRIEHGMYERRAAEVDVLDMLREVVRHQAPLARARHVTCSLTVNGQVPAPDATRPLLGEKLLLYSALSNLLKNAIEASPEGEPVTLAVSGDDVTTIAIRNRGEVLSGIRERFFEKGTTAGKAHGVGLGTYSAKMMTEAQGGSIYLDTSEPGATTITLEFPSGCRAT